MSASYRGSRLASLALILAAGFFLVFLPVASHIQYQPHQQTAGAGDQAKNADDEPERNDPAPPWPINWVVSSYQDNLAQWLMAIFAGMALGVSVWAVRLVGRNLEQARLATKAAVDTAEITRNALIAQERPWLTVDFQMAGGLSRNEREWSTGTDGILIKVENIGKTTAIDVTINAKLAFWPTIPAAQQFVVFEFAHQYIADKPFPIPGPIHIFPGANERVQRGISIPIKDVKELQSSENFGLFHFAILVCASYRSVLDQPGTDRKLTVVGKDVYKSRDGSDHFIDLFRGEVPDVPKGRIDLRQPIGKTAIIT
ncbi:MAG: hypothetical protein RIE78_15930 [Roseitalea porphyridii]